MPELRHDGLGELADDYLAALVDGDHPRARALVLGAAAQGVPADQLYLDVLCPAMHEVGRRWERLEMTVADEHLATAITQATIAALAEWLSPVARGEQPPSRTALVACGPDDHHGLGAQMVADFLHSAGWGVVNLGACVPPEDLAAAAERHGARLVAISSSLPEHLEGARRSCAAVKALPDAPLVVVGGQAYAGRPDPLALVGADVFADDPACLVQALGRRGL